MNRSFLRTHCPLLVHILILICPAMDVLSYWLNYFQLGNTLTLCLRFLVLLITLTAGFILAEKKRPYFLLLGVLLLLTAGHIAACLQIGYSDPVYDLTNLIRIYLLPITALCFMTFLKACPDNYGRIIRDFRICLLIIAAVELLSWITGTNPYTYPNKEIGLLGWFYFANCQSAILVMLIPVAIFSCIKKKLPVFFCISTLGLGMLYLFATRLAYLGLVLTGAGLCVSLFFAGKAHRPRAIWLGALTLVFILLLPVSPMTKNQKLVSANLVLKQQHIDEMVAADEASARDAGKSGDEIALLRLNDAYTEYLPGLVETFGLERTAEAYDYSTSASDITDYRRAKITYSKLLLEDSTALSAVFGMEYGRWRCQDISYDVENDFHGIFFLCGGAGFALLALFLLYFILPFLRVLLKQPKKILAPEVVCLCVACVNCAAHIWCTAGVLRRPNSSFYFAICLALVWYLTASLRNPEQNPLSPVQAPEAEAGTERMLR